MKINQNFYGDRNKNIQQKIINIIDEENKLFKIFSFSKDFNFDKAIDKISLYEKDTRKKINELLSDKNIIITFITLFCFVASIYFFFFIIFKQQVDFKSFIFPVILFFIYLFFAPKVSNNLYYFLVLRKKLKIIQSIKYELIKAQIYYHLTNENEPKEKSLD